MSDELKNYLGCGKIEDKNKPATQTKKTSSDSNLLFNSSKETQEKVFSLDAIGAENTDTSRITRQDVIAIDTIHQYMHALDTNDENKIREIFPAYTGINPGQEKFLKETSPGFILDKYSDSQIDLITVKYYSINKIIGALVYTTKLSSKTGKYKDIESVNNCIFTLKKENDRWIIEKLKLGNIKEDVSSWVNIMSKYKTDKIDDAYIEELNKEYLDAKPLPKTVIFNGQIFYLASAEPITEIKGFMNEYLPHGESFPRFNNMVGFYYYQEQADPINVLKTHIQQSQQRMPEGIEMPYAIYTTDRRDTSIACFVMVAADPNSNGKEKSLIWEFNVYKCKYSSKRNATVELQYAFRMYGMPSQTETMEIYKKLLTQLAIEMYYTPIPEVYKKM